MIGVQYHWWFVEDTLEHLRVHFNFLCGRRLYSKLTFKSNFALWSSFQVKFERVINGLGGQKSLRAQTKYGLMGSSAKTGNIFIGGSQEQKKMDPKHKNAIWDGTSPTYMCAGGVRVPNLQTELNYLDSFKSYCNFSDLGFLSSRGWGRWVGGYLGWTTIVYMSSGVFRGKESSDRIELSRLVQDLLKFGVLGSLWLWGGGRWVEGYLGAWGVPPHACTCMCT